MDGHGFHSYVKPEGKNTEHFESNVSWKIAPKSKCPISLANTTQQTLSRPQYLRKSTKRTQSFGMSGKSDQKSPNGKISGGMLLVFHGITMLSDDSKVRSG